MSFATFSHFKTMLLHFLSTECTNARNILRLFFSSIYNSYLHKRLILRIKKYTTSENTLKTIKHIY